MKKSIAKTLAFVIVVLVMLSSCSRALTPGEAANHHYKKCRDIR